MQDAVAVGEQRLEPQHVLPGALAAGTRDQVLDALELALLLLTDPAVDPAQGPEEKEEAASGDSKKK